MLDLGQQGFRFTSAQAGVKFDLDADGSRDSIAWTDPAVKEGFLAWDRNLNGIIDSGRELFGNATLQPPADEPNGYLALAVLDQPENGGNGDSVISNQDRLWNALQLWIDLNHNGFSEERELSSLSSQKIISIDLAYRESRRKDRYGNELRYRSRALAEDGQVIDTLDVFFQRLP